MRTIIQTSMDSMVVALALSGCQKAVDQAAPQATAPAVEPAQATWPASLPVFGDGFPNPGEPCRRVGESTLG